MISKWYTCEDGITFDGSDNLLGCWFGLEDWEYRTHAREHARTNKIRCHRSDMHIGFELLQFNTHALAPSNHSPLASTIDRHLRVAQHTSRRSDIADVSAIAAEHVGQYLQG